MTMQISEVMMPSPHNFPFILYTEEKEKRKKKREKKKKKKKKKKKSYFSYMYENVRLVLIPL